MNKQTFDINKLRIASPCPVGWETMKGDARTRHCDLCQLNVYNVLNDKGPLPRTAVDDGRGNPIYVRNYLPEPITFQLTNTIRF